MTIKMKDIIIEQLTTLNGERDVFKIGVDGWMAKTSIHFDYKG